MVRASAGSWSGCSALFNESMSYYHAAIGRILTKTFTALSAGMTLHRRNERASDMIALLPGV